MTGSCKGPLAKGASHVITQTISDKQNGMEEDLKLFQARKQVCLKQFLKRRFGVHFLLFPSENDYVVRLLQCSTNLHSIFRLGALRYLDSTRENKGTEREAPGPAFGICHVHEF